MNKVVWCETEIKILKDNYDKLTIKELQNLVPDKNYKQIKAQILRMGYCFKKVERSRELTKADDNYILNNYAIKSIDELASILGVSRFAVKKRFTYLNIKSLTYGELEHNKFINSFSNQNIEFIKAHINDMSIMMIAKSLDRSYDDIYKLCKKLNLSFKSRKELLNDKYIELDKRILDIGTGKSIKDISELLNVDYDIIFRRINKLNIDYINDVPKWSEQEKQQLLDLYLSTPLDDLCIILKRSKGSIIENAKKLNIDLLKNNHIDNTKLNEEQYEYLVNNFNEIPLIEICNHLQINARNIIIKAYLLRLYNFNLKGMHSLLEKVVSKILNEYKISYVSQYKIKTNTSYILCDFKINNSNKIIEVYGDFWHGKDMPNKKNDPRNLEQIRNRDVERETIIKQNKNELLIIWESDIINNLQKVYEQINDFVN